MRNMSEREKVALQLASRPDGVTDIQLGRELQSRLLNPEEPWKLLCELKRDGLVWHTTPNRAVEVPTWYTTYAF